MIKEQTRLKTSLLIILTGLVILLVGFLAAIKLFVEQDSQNMVYSQKNIIDQQTELEASLLAAYENGDYSLQQPFLVQDPFGNSPLSAVILFSSEFKARVTVQVKGKNEAPDLVYAYEDYVTEHEVPIFGLFPAFENQVTIRLTLEDGNIQEEIFTFQTEDLPIDFFEIEVITSEPDKMEPGWTLVNTELYKFLMDPTGEVRWYLNLKSNNILTALGNGEFLIAYLPSEPYSIGDPPDKLIKTNLLGKISAYYFTPQIHHDVISYHESYLATVNEEIYQFDQQEGTLIEDSLQLRQYFPKSRVFDYISDSESLHVNALVTGGDLEDSVLVSARNQHAVILVDYENEKLEWILGTPDGWTEEFEPYLLQPTGEIFEWFWMQHTPKVLPDLDQNPETIDILLFDNGAYRENVVDLSEAEEYSRMVHYRINPQAHTIEQIWEYGKERGFELFSSIKGNACYLSEKGTYLGTFAEVQSPYDENRYDGVIIETDVNKIVLFEARLLNTRYLYRAERISLDELIPVISLGDAGKYLQNEKPYTIYSYPQLDDSETEKLNPGFFYSYFCEDSLINCQLWENRLSRRGLISSEALPLLSLEIGSVSMVDSDLFVNGKADLGQDDEKNLYLSLSNKTNQFVFDITSSIFGNSGEDGLCEFYVNYLNLSGLPAGDYDVCFYSVFPEKTSLLKSNYEIHIP